MRAVTEDIMEKELNFNEFDAAIRSAILSHKNWLIKTVHMPSVMMTNCIADELKAITSDFQKIHR